MMKKIICLVVVVMSVFAVVGCSTKEAQVVNVPVKDIISNIENEVETISQLMEIDLKDEEMPQINKDIAKAYNINGEDIEEGIIKCPMINLTVDEIAVLKVTDESKIPAIEEALKQHVEVVLKSFENYMPENYEVAKNYILKSNGNYVFFVISQDAEKIEEIFDDSFAAK